MRRFARRVGAFAEKVGKRAYDEKFLMTALLITVVLAIVIPLRSNRVTNEGVRTTVDQTRQTQLDNSDTNRRIKDCVDPNGKCFKEGQARTAAFIKQLEEHVIITNACASAVPRGLTLPEAEAQIRGCIADRTRVPPGR